MIKVDQNNMKRLFLSLINQIFKLNQEYYNFLLKINEIEEAEGMLTKHIELKQEMHHQMFEEHFKFTQIITTILAF